MMTSYFDGTPDDEMSLAKSEMAELANIWIFFAGDNESQQAIRRISQLPNKLPTLIYLQGKIRQRKKAKGEELCLTKKE